MDGICYDSLVSVSRRIQSRDLSSIDVTTALIERIERVDPVLHSYATVAKDHAFRTAKALDAELRASRHRSPLHGVPIAVKDLCDTAFAPTTSGTSVHRTRQPRCNATIIGRLEQAGAVILGKLTMTEGAYTSHHPSVSAPLNPWNKDHWVGSSSTGSGVATAAGLCYAAIGSDTGGSIRFPSATCGLTGIKPTWGRVSRHGVSALAASLDHIGPMARSAADAASLLEVIAGSDVRDPTCLKDRVPNYSAEIEDGLRGVTIGVDTDYAAHDVDPQVRDAWEAAVKLFAGLGAKIREVKFPAYKQLVRGWIPFCSVEAAIAHLETYPHLANEYGPELKALIEQGRSTSGIEFAQIYHERLAFSGAIDAMFEDIDLLSIPTMPVPIPSLTKMGEYGQNPDVLEGILRFTAPFDFSGSPTITLPNGLDEKGLPLSMQLVGRHLSEGLLCKAAHAFQQVTRWHALRPDL